MEHPVKNDFFLRFKALFNEKNEFIDYILMETSEDFKNLSGRQADKLIGKSLSTLIVTEGDFIPDEKELYYHMIPNTKRKFERYIKDLNHWYLISIFSDRKDYMLVFYSNISKLKEAGGVDKANISKDNRVVADLQDYMMKNYYKDKLTGLYNKSFFDIELSRLDTERQLPLSFIIGDLNGLKLINDAFGHHTGDEAIKKAADILKKVFRKEDIISRFGGDEFAILLPQANESTCIRIIERLKEEFANNPLDFLQLNMSFGAATKTSMEENINELIVNADENMYFNKLTESKEAKQNMIDHLRKKLDEIGDETKGHHDRLKYMSKLMADRLDLGDMEREELNLLCDFHDIGKTGIPYHIIHKKDPLTSDEWLKLKRHSEIGYHIMKSSKESANLDELVLVHHERWDGRGYPGLLKGGEIPLVARIFAIVDAYEAMVNDRPYKKRMSAGEALREIKANGGSQFDPYLADIFIDLMKTTSLKSG